VWSGCLQIVLDKGQEDDWFGATWVRWTVATLVVSLVLWLWHSWTHRDGLVDLHILKDPNFRTGCFLFALLGMCIYITIAILPLYYQEILGYTAFTAGMVVAPRGLGSIVGSPIIGILGSHIDNRKLLCFGFLGFGICALTFGMVNLDIGPFTLLIPITLTGIALSFCFVPLATLSMSTISNREIGNAAGLYAMLRNIGGSIGIAMASTALVRRAAFHQTNIGANITSSTWVLQQKSAAITGYMGHRFGPAQGHHDALGLMYGMLEQQAALKAYVDVFRWTALLAFFCAGAAWLFKKPAKVGAPPTGAH
jgi:DHA2 family multidrug resistance protein